ncbi:unnamed protein product [Heligmosomoides polygyrus]|uniref:Col_cuticle_N domain-containing protein n=1 Tax=Heligmosomoides polygyrus TaxID=6339 RepID=A0A183FHF1_HELPZ|nr:unnamed protein product [Heligmosomoides polygyrus]
MYNIIFISLSVVLGLTLLGQLFLAIYLNRVQNHYVLMELNALDALHVEFVSEEEDEEGEPEQKSELRSDLSGLKGAKTETVPEELLSQKSLVMLKSEQIRQLSFRLPGM